MSDILSSELLFHSSRHQIRSDLLRATDGGTYEYEVLLRPDAVVTIPVLPDGRVLFVAQYRHPVQSQVLDLPGGNIDPGEGAEAAAHRELLEETGYASDHLQMLLRFCPDPGLSPQTITIYLAEGLRNVAEPQAEAASELRVCPVPATQLPELLSASPPSVPPLLSSWSVIGVLLLLRSQQYLEKKR